MLGPYTADGDDNNVEVRDTTGLVAFADRDTDGRWSVCWVDRARDLETFNTRGEAVGAIFAILYQ